MKKITIKGVVYKIRYTYTREDGSIWYVLNVTDVTAVFEGEYGDEVKAS